MKIFPDIHTVSHSECKKLQGIGVLTYDNTVVTMKRLSEKMVARKITPQDAKTLVLLELERLPAPRMDIVNRLVNYVSYSSKEKTMEKINKYLNES